MRRILDSKKNENEKWGMLYNEELLSSYSSPNIGRVIKLDDWWAVHIRGIHKLRHTLREEEGVDEV